MRHHIIITGTGRAGTTFLVRLFTYLGFDTGFTKKSAIDPVAHAGLETVIEDWNAPYIVKQPQLCERLDTIMERGDILIDHAIIPRRDLFAAAESRRVNARQNPKVTPSEVIGGTFGTDSLAVGDQEAALQRLEKKLWDAISTYQIPYTELWFPDDFQDAERLFQKLGPVFDCVAEEQGIRVTPAKFLATHSELWNPKLVHKYQPPAS
ncbi:MAG: hypothetical protein JSS02_22240 [Planctomycetes bacterium]|nr:hypothetical protein [Planctomycetota bacterium]